MRKIFLRFAMITVFLLCESVAPSILKYAHSFKIPDTDQRRCFQALYPYDEITCPASGNPLAQDGSYITYPLSYTDNGNGTVSDNNTGLTWQRKDDSKTRTWADASTYCANLKLGNHDDWRLPSMDELMSIVDYAIPAPGPTIHSFFKNTKASEYWTTAYRSVNFNDGAVYYYSRGQHYVRCVRGTQWQQEFLDMGNGTVTDLRTRLRWQQGEPGSMTWDKALSYCEGLSLAHL
ncbi:Protein of unknown function [Syntrophus gentianae]|uniref:Lcl C-terminal domain-containing protein n=1 Tax=Syntrophus gentianae TaxID=43775 RepID=A0A1H8AWL1_9BACT|nr:DUF1566 domain-containing protein [Syntrophus gentianae]SEM73887.1 Protein of unknown function [Syntrophus gentianae]